MMAAPCRCTVRIMMASNIVSSLPGASRDLVWSVPCFWQCDLGLAERGRYFSRTARCIIA